MENEPIADTLFAGGVLDPRRHISLQLLYDFESSLGRLPCQLGPDHAGRAEDEPVGRVSSLNRGWITRSDRLRLERGFVPTVLTGCWTPSTLQGFAQPIALITPRLLGCPKNNYRNDQAKTENGNNVESHFSFFSCLWSPQKGERRARRPIG